MGPIGKIGPTLNPEPTVEEAAFPQGPESKKLFVGGLLAEIWDNAASCMHWERSSIYRVILEEPTRTGAQSV